MANTMMAAMALVLCVVAVGRLCAEEPSAPASAAEAGASADGPAQIEPIRTVAIGAHGELRVNDKPFIPIRAGAQDVKRFPLLRSLGFNTFHRNFGGKPPAREYCDKAWAVNAYAIPLWGSEAEGDSARGHPALLAWTHTDEPDLGLNKGGQPRMTPEEIIARYKEMKAADPARPMWLTFTAMFMTDSPPSHRITQEQRLAYYGKAVEGGDIIAFDIYPVYGWNRPEKIDWVAGGVTQLRRFAGKGRAVAAVIESCKGTQFIDYEKQKDVLPEHTRAEVWMALIRGARIIGYFCHAWKPKFTEFNCTDEMQAELKRLNHQIARLTPALCAAPTERTITMELRAPTGGEAPERPACHFAATEHDGALWVFAQNIDMERRSGRATLRIEGLGAGARVDVVDESRTLTAEEGAFSDDFAPLREHVYRIARGR